MVLNSELLTLNTRMVGRIVLDWAFQILKRDYFILLLNPSSGRVQEKTPSRQKESVAACIQADSILSNAGDWRSEPNLRYQMPYRAVHYNHMTYFPAVGSLNHTVSTVTRLQRIYPRQSLVLGQGQRHPSIHKSVEPN